MAPTCIIRTTQPFFVFKVSPAISGSTWSISHLMRTACLMFFFDSPLPFNWPRRTSYHGHAASIFQKKVASLRRCCPGSSAPTKYSRCQTVLPSLWSPLHFWIHSVARADGKTALLPSHLYANLGPKATALGLWIWQSEKIVSYFVWGPFLNRSHIYSLGLK